MITSSHKHELQIIYEEAISRPRNSDGAWHIELIDYVITLGYPIKTYQQAKVVTETILFGNKHDLPKTIDVSAADKGK